MLCRSLQRRHLCRTTSGWFVWSVMHLIMPLKARWEPDGTYGIHVNSEKRLREEEKQYSHSIYFCVLLTGSQVADADLRCAERSRAMGLGRAGAGIPGREETITAELIKMMQFSYQKYILALPGFCLLKFFFCIPLFLFLLCSSQILTSPLNQRVVSDHLTAHGYLHYSQAEKELTKLWLALELSYD